VHEQISGAEYRFVMPGPTLSEAEWRSCLQALMDLNPFPVWAVASGSLPPGVPADFYAQLAHLCRERGAKLVLDAAGPALAAATTEGLWCADPLAVPVVSAVGAGDSFVGNMVWALHDGQPLVDAFAWGVAAGSATLLTAGTALCRAKDVHRLRTQVVLSVPAALGVH
jgi:6-phosphofructokinase 2